MSGPYALTSEAVTLAVTKAKIGNYALGYLRADGVFMVGRTGRSDKCTLGRLLTHAGERDYAQFMFSYAATVREAFVIECHLYHDFPCPGNKAHPQRPPDEKWPCPRCSVFGLSLFGMPYLGS